MKNMDVYEDVYYTIREKILDIDDYPECEPKDWKSYLMGILDMSSASMKTLASDEK